MTSPVNSESLRHKTECLVEDMGWLIRDFGCIPSACDAYKRLLDCRKYRFSSGWFSPVHHIPTLCVLSLTCQLDLYSLEILKSSVRGFEVGISLNMCYRFVSSMLMSRSVVFRQSTSEITLLSLHAIEDRERENRAEINLQSFICIRYAFFENWQYLGMNFLGPAITVSLSI